VGVVLGAHGGSLRAGPGQLPFTDVRFYTIHVTRKSERIEH